MPCDQYGKETIAFSGGVGSATTGCGCMTCLRVELQASEVYCVFHVVLIYITLLVLGRI